MRLIFDFHRAVLVAPVIVLLGCGWLLIGANIRDSIRPVSDAQAIGIVGGIGDCCQQVAQFQYGCGSYECCGTYVGIPCGGGTYYQVVGGLGQSGPGANQNVNCVTCYLCTICSVVNVPTTTGCGCGLTIREPARRNGTPVLAAIDR